ncbi:hypothetical protein PRZ48_010728 [Zasmidium cellare]|uniref:Uncharacterized protein n=1 Tax=Zasmidium cellare TaxID=395010 RepID=A0ABR0E9I0_ZASCE|nr:hypothetical protein PRZ48_010728 [Zasmidium cellare]
MSVDKPSYQSMAIDSRPKNNGTWKFLPWTGLVSLILAVACGIAALVVGLASNGIPVDSWKVGTYVVQPSVLLSVLATIANALLGMAFTDGVAIVWWLQSCRGARLRRLNALYEHGQSVLGVVMAPDFNKVTVAALAMLLLLADGPLLQRASKTTQSTGSKTGLITVGVSTSPLLYGATGIITGHDQLNASLYTPGFTQILQQYNSRSRIVIPGLQYSGTIEMSLTAPGWDVQCDNGTTPYRLISSQELEQWQPNQTTNTTPRTQTMFETNVTYLTELEDNYPGYHIQISTSYKSTPGGNGTKLWRQCNLTEASIRYPLRITDGTISLLPMPLAQNRTNYLITRAFEQSALDPVDSSSLGGFQIALQNAFASKAELLTDVLTSDLAVVQVNEDAVANQYVSPTVTGQDFGTYGIFWTDPTDDFLAMAHELALRAAIALTNQSDASLGSIATSYAQQTICPSCVQPYISSPDLTSVNRTVSQQVEATMTPDILIYSTDVGWLVAGFVLMMVASTLVCTMYWDWWALETNTTMNPLSVATAFDAPLLRGVGPSMLPAKWGKDVLGTKVQYSEGDGVGINEEDQMQDRGEQAEVEGGLDGDEEGSRENLQKSSERTTMFRKVQ